MGNSLLSAASSICEEDPVDRIKWLKARHRKLTERTEKISDALDKLLQEEARKRGQAAEITATFAPLSF
jgi:prefoldin subunit 5